MLLLLKLVFLVFDFDFTISYRVSYKLKFIFRPKNNIVRETAALIFHYTRVQLTRRARRRVRRRARTILK
jgi:hypothetical protein